jgi:hypothetical protein
MNRGDFLGAKTFTLIGDESRNSDIYRTAFQSTLVQDAGLLMDFTDEEKLQGSLEPGV